MCDSFDCRLAVTFRHHEQRSPTTPDVAEIDFKSMIETINDELEHFYLYNPWWDMSRIVKGCVYTTSYDS